MKMFALPDKWISCDLQGCLGQSGERPEHKQAAKEEQSPQFRESKTPLVPYRSGHNHDENVQIVAQNHHDSGHDHKPVDTLEIGIHQNQKREHKVHYQHAEKGQFIIGYPGHKISDLLGNVRIPDQHELGEPKVGPEDAEPEHILGQIVDMTVVHILEIAP